MPEPVKKLIDEIVGLVDSGHYEEAEMVARSLTVLMQVYLQYPGAA